MLLLILVLAPISLHAAIWACPQADGSTRYTDRNTGVCQLMIDREAVPHRAAPQEMSRRPLPNDGASQPDREGEQRVEAWRRDHGPIPTLDAAARASVQEPMAPPPARREGDAGMVARLSLLLAGALLYFIPYGLARSRRHHNTTAIGLVNLFFGWTVLGWLIALIWAATSPPPKA